MSDRDFVTLTCPSCGGKLEITADIERFACAHCGAEHLVRRGGGTVSLKPVMDAIEAVKNGVDRTAVELALQRLRQDIEDLEKDQEDLHRSRRSYRQVIGLLSAVGVVALCVLAACLGDSGGPPLASIIISVGCGVFVLLLWLPAMALHRRWKRVKQTIADKQQRIAEHRLTLGED